MACFLQYDEILDFTMDLFNLQNGRRIRALQIQVLLQPICFWQGLPKDQVRSSLLNKTPNLASNFLLFTNAISIFFFPTLLSKFGILVIEQNWPQLVWGLKHHTGIHPNPGSGSMWGLNPLSLLYVKFTT